MTDVDQNNRQAQKWPELETKRLESAQASAKVDSKQRGLFDALSEVVKSGLKDLYGDANDPKYLYVVNLVMARVRAAIAEKLEDFGTDEVQNLTKLLDAKLAAQTKEQYESLSQTFTDVVQTAFSDLTVKVDADGKAELVDSVREYVETAVRELGENKSSDEVVSKLEEVKEKLLKQFGQDKPASAQEKPKADLKSKFKAKTQNLIQQQLTVLASNQKRLQANMSVSFKRTGALVDRNVGKLDSTINSSMDTISGKLSAIGRSVKQLSLGNIMSSVGGGMLKLLSGPFGLITGSLSKLWSGVCGLTKWAAGGLFSIIGKFFKTPAGLFAIGYMIGYAYTKWIKPWWDNIAKTEIGKWLNGEQGFLDMLKNTVMKTLGLDSNGGFIEQLKDKLLNVEICKLDNGILSSITGVINKVGEVAGLAKSSLPGSVTIGTAITAIAGLITANIAASILGNPVLASIAVIAASVAAMKSMLDKILGKLGIDTGVQTTTAAHAAGAALHVATAPVRNANAIIKTEAKVAKATQKAAKTAKALDKADDAIKAAQNAVKTASTAKEASKASTQLAKAEKNGEKALKAAVKAEESLEKTLVKLGIKQSKVSGFTKWLSKFPKVMKALKFLGPVGILASAGATIFELFEAYEAYQNGQTGMAALKTTKAVNAIAGLATGPAGMAVATATDLVLDRAVEWQSAVYDVENAEKDSIKLQQKLDASQKALAQKQLAKLSPEQILQKQLADYDKVKKEYDRLAAEEKRYNDELANMGWWDKHMAKSDALARSNAENARSRKNALLMKYGFKDEATLKDFEQKKLSIEQPKLDREIPNLEHPIPKLDFEMSQTAQRTIDDLRAQAQQTSDMTDDEFVEKIQAGFNSGNAQVIEMLKTIMINQQKQKPSINTVMSMQSPYNPATADAYGPALHAGLNR